MYRCLLPAPTENKYPTPSFHYFFQVDKSCILLKSVTHRLRSYAPCSMDPTVTLAIQNAIFKHIRNSKTSAYMRNNRSYSLSVEQTPCWAAPGDAPMCKGAEREGPVPPQQQPEGTHGHFSPGFLWNVSGQDFFLQAALLSVLLH